MSQNLYSGKFFTLRDEGGSDACVCAYAANRHAARVMVQFASYDGIQGHLAMDPDAALRMADDLQKAAAAASDAMAEAQWEERTGANVEAA